MPASFARTWGVMGKDLLLRTSAQTLGVHHPGATNSPGMRTQPLGTDHHHLL